MQSEAGVAGTLHGLLKAGTLAAAYTCSQGLLLMLPTIYKLVGELLPAVIHVAARSVASSALSIFGDHSDVMAVRQTGAVMLSAASVQEAALFSAVAHLTAVEGSLPVIHFFDGFNTSHELQKIEVPDYKVIKKRMDQAAYLAFKDKAISNEQPRAYGSSQTPDIFFQQLEAANAVHTAIPQIVQSCLEELNPLFQTNCSIVDYDGSNMAEVVIVIMGSVSGTVGQVVYEQNEAGNRCGVITIHLYRPFPTAFFLKKLPASVKTIVVLDRTKERGSQGEPLLLDVQSACYELPERPVIIGGRYGLGSKDVTPDQIRGVLHESRKARPKSRFTIGIIDDVTHLSLLPKGNKDLTGDTIYQVKVWGRGSDGAVSCSRQTVKIVGQETDLEVQGQFWHDAKKTGGLTVSQLRFGREAIRSAYKVQNSDFISCYDERYLKQYNVLAGLRENGIFLLNSSCPDAPGDAISVETKRFLARKNIQFYTINAGKIANQFNLGPYINTIMQTLFFYLTDLLPFEKAIQRLKEEIKKAYGEHDPAMVAANHRAMELAVANVMKVDVPERWNHFIADASFKRKPAEGARTFQTLIQQPLQKQEGNTISVGDLLRSGMIDGSLPLGTSAMEKRGIAEQLPAWDEEFCLQCNLCAAVCPHAAIRPFLMNAERSDAPPGFSTIPASGVESAMFRIQISPDDCTGCSLCAEACPAAPSALTMKAAGRWKEDENELWSYALQNGINDHPFRQTSLKGSQFNRPLLEFSGACAGCGETPYVKLLTQLFGDRIVIANATGCSSIWGCSLPSVPYTTNGDGCGPVWGNSLLENNAEYGYGMKLGLDVIQNHFLEEAEACLRQEKYSPLFRKTLEEWLEAYRLGRHTRKTAHQLIRALVNEKQTHPDLEPLYRLRRHLTARSQWIVGGDGWAYDIGFGGIDHIVAQGSNVNILVLDNEGYANTGGQASKAAPAASRVKLSSNGSNSSKKDFGLMMMSYGDVYVAQICMSADPNQTIAALTEAEAYPGPAIVIAYCPCVLHGMNSRSMLTEGKKAVECGYWTLYRYDPRKKKKGRSPMRIDSSPPKWSLFQDFLQGEARFSSVCRFNKKMGEALLAQNEANAKRRYSNYRMLSEMKMDENDTHKV